jgi:hypothetical protein
MRRAKFRSSVRSSHCLFARRPQNCASGYPRKLREGQLIGLCETWKRVLSSSSGQDFYVDFRASPPAGIYVLFCQPLSCLSATHANQCSRPKLVNGSENRCSFIFDKKPAYFWKRKVVTMDSCVGMAFALVVYANFMLNFDRTLIRSSISPGKSIIGK